MIPCSQQPDGVSCGVYSLAYCTLFAYGKSVDEILQVEFDCDDLWSWFRDEFRSRKLPPKLPPYKVCAKKRASSCFDLPLLAVPQAEPLPLAGHQQDASAGDKRPNDEPVKGRKRVYKK